MKAGGLAEGRFPPPTPALLCHPFRLSGLLAAHTHAYHQSSPHPMHPGDPRAESPQLQHAGPASAGRLSEDRAGRCPWWGRPFLCHIGFSVRRQTKSKPAHCLLPVSRLINLSEFTADQLESPDAGNVIKKPAQRPDARRGSVTDSRLQAKGGQDSTGVCRLESILSQPSRNRPDHQRGASRTQRAGQLGRNVALGAMQM